MIEQEKKIGILLYVLIFFAIVMIVFAIFSFKKPILSNKYVYTSPSGEQFEFYKYQIENITQHILTIYRVDQGVKHQVDIPFINDPYSLENIQIGNEVKDNILTKKGLFITLDPYGDSKSVLAAIEITRVIGTNDYGVFKIPTQSATIVQTNTTFPVKTCGDATQDIGVIYLAIGNQTQVFSYKNCVVVEGKTYDDLIKSADKLTLNLLGVM
jgi:hypothetical protein